MERFADDLDLAQFRLDQVTELAIAAIRRNSRPADGRKSCLDCGDMIPVMRLRYVPSATRCAHCQDRDERHATRVSRT